MPALGSAFTSSGHDPSFTLVAYKDLRGKFSLAANANVASVTDPRGRYFSSGESVWGARIIGGGVSLFAETFRTTIDRAEGREVVVDGGLFRSLGRHTQIDLSAGHTVSGLRPSWYASVGCAFRVPRGLLR
jgi:hypothetical protein